MSALNSIVGDKEDDKVRHQALVNKFEEIRARNKASARTNVRVSIDDSNVRSSRSARPLNAASSYQPYKPRRTDDSSTSGVYSTRLNIFKKGSANKQSNKLEESLLDQIEREELEALAGPPLNAFQQQILWTKQGKLWRFPIDNEQGCQEEEEDYQSGFQDHVFLEKHLARGFPHTGPIRNFMEIVCVALSKNAFYTVKEKIEFIDWYRDYFEEHSELIQQSFLD